MEDSQIIELYFARDQRAVAETDEKYGRYCFCLANSILENREDAEETLSDTYLRAWNAIPPVRPQVLRLYLARITRNLAFSRWRKDHAEKRGGGQMELVLEELDECIPAPGSPEEGLDGKEFAKLIREFLDTLGEKERGLFLRRYFYVEQTEQLAARYRMKPESVRKSLLRTRKKLKDYLNREGYAV